MYIRQLVTNCLLQLYIINMPLPLTLTKLFSRKMKLLISETYRLDHNTKLS